MKNKRKGKLKEKLLRQHVNHLKELKRQDILVLCGPFSDNDKAIKIIITNSFEEADAIAKSDPFTRNSYYQDYEIHELIEANDDNNYLLKDTLENI